MNTKIKTHKFSEKTIRKRIKNLDLDPIAQKLAKPKSKGGHGWSSPKIEKNIEIYRAFLFVIWKYPKIEHNPDPVMDEVWHTHILFTKKYMKDCNHIFGEYIHHKPYL